MIVSTCKTSYNIYYKETHHPTGNLIQLQWQHFIFVSYQWVAPRFRWKVTSGQILQRRHSISSLVIQNTQKLSIKSILLLEDWRYFIIKNMNSMKQGSQLVNKFTTSCGMKVHYHFHKNMLSFTNKFTVQWVEDKFAYTFTLFLT
jgi:hypothetical protein